MPPPDSPTGPGEALEIRAMRMAALHKARRRTEDRPRLLNRLKTQRILLHDAYLLFVRIAEEQELHSFAAEWLLDNYYIVQAALRQIQEDLPEKYYRQLPRLDSTRMAGFPRVFAIARELVFANGARIEVDQIERFINAYQHVAPLTVGELWAVPIMLRFSLLEALTQAATRVLDIETFDEGASGEEIDRSLPPDTIIANCITGLRTISIYDWKEFFERTSLVERVLAGDPVRIYQHMDFETRDRYRNEIENLSFETNQSQVEIARQAVALARVAYAQNWADTQKSHVGYYLIDRGRGSLEAALNYQPKGLDRLRRLLHRHPARTYITAIGALTALILGLVLLASLNAQPSIRVALVVLAVALIPTTAFAVSVVNWLVMLVLPPRLLPRIDYTKGIPDVAQTAVVIPALLTTSNEVDSLLSQLELHYLRNGDPNLIFGLLTDFSDSDEPKMPEDASLVEQAIQGIERLQNQYAGQAGRFFLLHRERRWNPEEGTWMGWERKRGKLEEFNHLITGSNGTTFAYRAGDLNNLDQIRFVITLDADTLLPPGSAARLVGSMAHPLNTAHFDEKRGRITSGYTVLQPRTEIKPTSASQTRFSRIFAGDRGLDLYTHAVSDVYQDLVGEGIYVGKGIYEVASFQRSTEGKIPENSLLSHDLLEGLLGRAGLVSDVVLYEEYPPSYQAYIRRMHRWMRGDWQLLPWLLSLGAGSGNGKQLLSPLDRWKIIDNLRRSLYAPMLLALLVLGWLWLPGSPLAWTLFALLMSAAPLVTNLVNRFVNLRKEDLQLEFFTADDTGTLLRWLLSVVFLPYEAFVSVDAIATTLNRMFITRRKLLEWTTSARVAQLFGEVKNPQLLVWREMVGGIIITLLVGALVAITRPTALPVAAAFLISWLVSPQVAYWLNQPTSKREKPLNEEQVNHLRTLARRTWYFFEKFVAPGDHWLPPDHFQENPRGTVAHRTSATNIGLGMSSTQAAYDMGYIGLEECLLRLTSTIDTLEQLEMHRGHYLNWYDTRTLKPLAPRYVSTVDSGNLAGCMLALRQGLIEMTQLPILRWQRWEGFQDTLRIFREAVGSLKQTGLEVASELDERLAEIQSQIEEHRNDPQSWPEVLENQLACWPQVEHNLLALLDTQPTIEPSLLQSLRIWVERARYHLSTMGREQSELLPWMNTLANPPELVTQAPSESLLGKTWQELSGYLNPGLCLDCLQRDEERVRALLVQFRKALLEDDQLSRLVDESLEWSNRLESEIDRAIANAQRLLTEIEKIQAWIDLRISKMDFRFLYNSQRHVFHIGYNLDSEHMDATYYDLLASESRIASLIAIAKGDVPQQHWLHLGRPLTRVGQNLALLSWSGTMFEYLMPVLFTREFSQSLLRESSETAVQQQIQYGRQKGVPWGISESGFYYFDANQNYQYRAFGVPGLGFKRGLSDDLVIAPYASLLALAVSPGEVMKNLDEFKKLNLVTDYGLYEAIDYTAERLPLGQTHAIVKSFMAHHQGMILLAILNRLQNDNFVDRFHANPLIQSVEMLLQEQIPQGAPLEHLAEEDEEAPSRLVIEPQIVASPWRTPGENASPRTHTLSNGSYGLLITNHGSGYSTWQKLALTRWRADSTLDDWGNWIYVQDLDSGRYWTAEGQMVPAPGGQTEVFFSAHKADFHTHVEGIRLHMQVVVAQEDDVEIRLVRLSNTSNEPRRLALTSYGEVVMTSLDADRRHPAFNKIIIESEFNTGQNALLFHRRKRSDEDSPIYLMHTLVMATDQPAGGRLSYETNRLRFLGRGRTVRNPLALESGSSALSGMVGYVLDPIFALRQEIRMPAHSSCQVAFLTAAAASRQDLLATARHFQDWTRIEQTIDQARFAAEIEVRRLSITTQDLESYQNLLSTLIYPQPALRAPASVLSSNTLGQPALWAFGISGDYPILLVKIGDREDLSLLRELLPAHTFWRNRNLMIDVVVLSEQLSVYGQEVHDRVYQTLLHSEHADWINRRGGFYLIRRDQMNDAEYNLLHASARAVLNSANGPLQRQLEVLHRMPLYLPGFIPVSGDFSRIEEVQPVERPANLQYDNGWGGFSADGREYQVYLEPGQWTPAPWINVIANPKAGFWVSESGGGYSWTINSGENRLTPWSNDPVSDRPGEALYLRDEETAAVWSPTPLPTGGDAPTLVRHGAGYTIFEHNSHGMCQTLRLFVPRYEPVKIIHLRLENGWDRTRRITATYYAELVLGVTRDQSQQFILPEYENSHHSLLATNPYNVEFGQRVAFLAASRIPHGLTTNRTEFLGQMGNHARPAALSRVGLSGEAQPGNDPCAAIQIHVDLAPGESEDIYFLLGQGEDRAEALACIEQFASLEQIDAAFEEVTSFWDGFLNTLEVSTPEQEMDLVLNRWLLYQNLACRFWGRSALYQSSGAYGFRDQLQDVSGLLLSAPELSRGHIIRAAHYQFSEGDVLHWWHPPAGRGVRTRHSDDLLWLPYVTSEYLDVTGDTAILQEQIPFLLAEPLKEDEEDRYGLYPSSEETFSLYEHCRRAILHASTSGPHGLPLIGTGDWNDGMNRVGVEGRGESIWLGWFLSTILDRFIPICRLVGDEAQAEAFEQQADQLRANLHAHAWDGDWYLRAFYDNGHPLGSHANEECRIDSLAQSWAVISGAGDPDRNRQAMQSVYDLLVQQDGRLLRLFTPSFDKTPHDPGYIKAYPPGIRENGGQYTHAAIWAVWAYTMLGQGDRAGELFQLINPVTHAATHELAEDYRVEPYVIAADVYSDPPNTGQGGWTWYTGSGGWMYRLGVEAILGLRRRGKNLVIDPCIPSGWDGYTLTYRSNGTTYTIRVDNPEGVQTGVMEVIVDGQSQPSLLIPLVLDGSQHHVTVRLGSGGTRPCYEPVQTVEQPED